MSDDEGFGDLFGGVEETPEYPLQTLCIDRLQLAAEGATYDYFEPLLDRFDHISSAEDALAEIAQLRERLVALAPPPLDVKFRDKRHSLWGHKLWNAAKYLVKRMDERLIDVRDKAVIELGAGLGVPTLAAFKNGARLSVVTDYPDADLLDIIQLNVEANCAPGDVDADVKAEMQEKLRAQCARDGRAPPTPEQLEAAVRTRCIVEPLLWGKKEHIDKVMAYTVGGAGYDIVILSDILFNHVCNDDLADTLATLLAKSPQAAGYCVFSHHRAYKQLHDFEFFDKCVRRGLLYEQLDEQDYPMMFPEDRGPEEVRQPVKCYKITRRYDAAGYGLDVNLRFDVVLQGTGMVQSILSAALARSGLKVLHCDGEDHYAAAMATFDDKDLVRHLQHVSATSLPGVPPAVVPINRMADIPDDRRRKYLFDVLPMSYLARGPLLRKLAAAGMTNSLECQHVSRFLFLQHRDGSESSPTTTAMEVPLTRASVFGNTAVGLFDKRRMMRFVKDVEASLAEQLHAKTANPADDPTFANTSAAAEAAAAEAAAIFAKEACANPGVTLREVLQKKYDLSGTALEVVSLMGMMDVLPTKEELADAHSKHKPEQPSPSQPSLVQSVDMERDLLLSTGAFDGKSPYLTTSFGAAELAQSMCRTSAVWGGVFVLRRSLRGVAVDEEKETQYAVLSNGQWVPAKVIVTPTELAGSYLTYAVQDWYYDILREHEHGRTPLIPLEAAGASATSSVTMDPDSGTTAAGFPVPSAVRFSRVILATKTASLFSWDALLAAKVIEADSTRDFTGAAPVITALVREPTTQAVVWVMQQSFACDQAPARFTETDGSSDALCDPCVLHFTADGHQLSQEQLLDYVMRCFTTASTTSAAADTNPAASYRVCERDIAFAAAFTIDAANVAHSGVVANPVEVPSETRWTHLFGWEESTKLRHANEHDRRHLLRRRSSAAAGAAHQAEDDDDDGLSPASPTTTSARATEMCRTSEHFRMVEVPTLLPNFVYDGHYLQSAEAAYDTILRELHVNGASSPSNAAEGGENPFAFLKPLPPQ